MKTMKNFLAIAAAMGALVASGHAMAGLTYISGTNCHNMFANESHHNTYSNDGVRSDNKGQHWIVCPIQVENSNVTLNPPPQPISAGFAAVTTPFISVPFGTVTITAFTGTKPIGCTLYSWSNTGAQLGSKSVTIPAATLGTPVPLGPVVAGGVAGAAGVVPASYGAPGFGNSVTVATTNTLTAANAVPTTATSMASMVCNIPPASKGVFKITGIEANF